MQILQECHVSSSKKLYGHLTLQSLYLLSNAYILNQERIRPVFAFLFTLFENMQYRYTCTIYSCCFCTYVCVYTLYYACRYICLCVGQSNQYSTSNPDSSRVYRGMPDFGFFAKKTNQKIRENDVHLVLPLSPSLIYFDCNFAQPKHNIYPPGQTVCTLQLMGYGYYIPDQLIKVLGNQTFLS